MVSAQAAQTHVTREGCNVIAPAEFRPRGRNPRRYPNVPRVKKKYRTVSMQKVSRFDETRRARWSRLIFSLCAWLNNRANWVWQRVAFAELWVALHICSQKGLPVQFVVEQGNHAQARRKGKMTTNKKNSGSLNPPPRGGGGRVVLPYLYGCVPLDRVWCMMVCGHSALIGIYCQDFKPPATPLYPTWDKYPIPRGGGGGGGALYLLSEYFAVFGRTWL